MSRVAPERLSRAEKGRAMIDLYTAATPDGHKASVTLEELGLEYTIADIGNWCWVRTDKWSGVSIEGLPNLKRWLDAILARPAVARGIEVPVAVRNLVDDEDAARRFADDARKTLQT